MSLSPSASAARKRRRVDGDAIDLSVSPQLSPAAALSPSSVVDEGQPQPEESKAEIKRKVATKQAGALFLGAEEEREEGADTVFSTPSPLAASPAPIVLSPSPSPSASASSSARPQRAAKQEAIARVQAFSVSLNDNREVSAAESKAAAAAAAAARSATANASTPAAASASASRRRPSRNSGSRRARSSSSSRRSHQKKAVSSAAMEDDEDDTDSVQIIEKESSAAATKEEEEEEEMEEEGPNEEDMIDEEEEVEQVRSKPVHGKRPQQAASQGKRAGNTPANASSSKKPGYKSATKHQTGANAASSAPKSSASSVASASSSSSAAPSSSRTSHPRASSSAGPSSTYYAHLSIEGMPDKRERDRRRDKRVSGFGAWKVVHKSHIPAMTYWGYEDLATETLEEETVDAIRRSRVYEPAGVEPYHRPPWDIIYGITEPPLTLFRRVDTKYGREEYKVKAQRNIEAKEVVAFLGGRLMEQTKADKQQLDEWNQHFHMNKSWLHEFFEYEGSHNLVISTKGHSCIARYIRSPEERVDDGEEGPNVKTDVVLDPKGGLFFVIYYALVPIRRGAELFCMPFLGEWQTRCHREMFLYSRVSHWHHKWALRLERTLLAAGVSFDTTRPEDITPRILTPEQEEKFLTIPGFDQGVLPDPLPLDQSMTIIPMDSAMEYAGCEYSTQAQLVEISHTTQHCIDAVGTFIPDYLDIKNPLWNETGAAATTSSTAKTSSKASSSANTPSSSDMAVVEEIVEVEGMEEVKEREATVAAAASSSSSSASVPPSPLPSPSSAPSSSPAPSPTTNPRAIVLGETIRIRVDKAAVLDLIHKGYREDLVELREDFGIHSPVRHFTPPCYRAFCVVATQHIPMGTFVFCYAGQITEAVVNRDSAYVYTMERDQIRRTVRSYHGPDLFLDAMKVGNISRFVNDSMYRSGEAEGKGATANVETQFLFYKPTPDAPGTIHLGFYTTKDVTPGQELVSQYGEEYWKTINKQLIGEHKKFFDYINPYTRKLERLAIKHKLPLPPPPPEQWNVPGEELFEPKPLPYPPLEEKKKKKETPSEQEEEGYEVERILNAKVGEDGQKWYYVKWKHHSSAHNEWIPQRNILDCQQLIAEFEESERSKRGGSSSKANHNKNNKNNKSGGASTKSTSHKKK